MNIQLFAPVYAVDKCINNIRDCLEKGWTGNGYKTVEFENAWKAYTGLKNAHFVTTGTAGLNLAVETLKEVYGWKNEDEIISTPLTFVATNNSILFSNLSPVFADVDDTLCLDPIDVESKITSRTRAIIFVGLGGNTGNYLKIVELCKKYELKLILDAAHMAGTRLNGVIPGSEADAVVYSFHVTKNLSIAESGMVCFKEDELDSIVRNKTFNGIDKQHGPLQSCKDNKWEYDVRYLADCYNGNSIMASIGLAQLPQLDQENSIRRKIAEQYDKKFEEFNDKITLIKNGDGCESSKWLYQLIVKKRDSLLRYLSDSGIGCGIHYPDNTLYWMYKNQKGKCERASFYSKHIISLPMHVKLTKTEIDYVIDKVIEFVNK